MDRRQLPSNGATKTPKGAGYTTRVDGKKILTTSLLEQQLDHAQAKLRELQKQNMLLRIKETMQLETLEGIEMVVYFMAFLSQPGVGPQQAMQRFLPAMLLDMEALELKQALQPFPQQQDSPAAVFPPAIPQRATNLISSTVAAVQAARAARSDGGTVSSSSSGSGSGSSDASEMAWSGGPVHAPLVGPSGWRMQRLTASITLEEVQEAKALSLQGAAERLRDAMFGVAKARREADEDTSGAAPEAAPAGVTAAMDNYIRTKLLLLLSDEPRHCQLIGLNLETLQREVPPDGVWHEAVRQAKLLPEQQQHIAMALQASMQQQAQLLQKQQAIMQQLQALLGAAAAAGPQDAAAAAAAAASATSSPGPCSLAASFAAAVTASSAADDDEEHPRGVAAAGGAAAAAATAASAASSSYVPPGGLPGGVLAVDDAEEAERLLQEWQQVCWAMKRQGRFLARMLMNLLSSEQLADATIAGYPYIMPAPKFCACAVQQMSQQ